MVQVGPAAQAFLGGQETRFPVSSGSPFVGHVDDGDQGVLGARAAGRAGREFPPVVLVPVEGNVERVAIDDGDPESPWSMFGGAEGEEGGVWVEGGGGGEMGKSLFDERNVHALGFRGDVRRLQLGRGHVHVARPGDSVSRSHSTTSAWSTVVSGCQPEERVSGCQPEEVQVTAQRSWGEVRGRGSAGVRDMM